MDKFILGRMVEKIASTINYAKPIIPYSPNNSLAQESFAKRLLKDKPLTQESNLKRRL
jgi:hypothetical protein